MKQAVRNCCDVWIDFGHLIYIAWLLHTNSLVEGTQLLHELVPHSVQGKALCPVSFRVRLVSTIAWPQA